ncbi:MAG: hypothetical protein HY815_21065 [Candidatus Riflebacteria bacterium]|nr:hypothetical protein [Candidatus Riflebacteria bacterium]
MIHPKSTTSPTGRRGVSPLLLVLLLMIVFSIIGVVQYSSSMRTLGEVHRAQLSALAREQASSAIQELLARIVGGVNDPASPLFGRIRERIDEPFTTIDLAPLLTKPDHKLVPGWGRQASRTREGASVGSVTAWSARILSTRSCHDIQGSEEWVGLLELSVDAQMVDAAATVRRQLKESYEIRTILAGPPRPFDQLALYLGRLGRITDARWVNTVRHDLIRRQEDLKRRIVATSPAGLSESAARRLAAIAGAILPTEEVQKRTPVTPEEEPALWGLYGGELPLERLDLARRLQSLDARVRAAEAELASVQGSPESAVPALERVVTRYSEALNAIWEYHRALTIVPRRSERFRRTIEPFLPRLTPWHFLDRANLVLRPHDAALTDWLAGARRLEGVVDASQLEERLSLTGEVQGRVVMLVGARGAALANLNRAASLAGHRLTVVSLGGDVEITGEVPTVGSRYRPAPSWWETSSCRTHLHRDSTWKACSATIRSCSPPTRRRRPSRRGFAATTWWRSLQPRSSPRAATAEVSLFWARRSAGPAPAWRDAAWAAAR